MSPSKEYIEHLTFKFNRGEISQEELDILSNWYNGHDDQQVTILVKEPDSTETVKTRILDNLLGRLAVEKKETIKPLRRWRWMAAAVVFMAAGATAWLLLDKDVSDKGIKTVSTTIEPGSNKATLTLADGRTIALSSSQSGIVAGDVITYADGSIVDNKVLKDIGINELVLSTPNGGTYQVILPDGSEVWLNAASEIKYPSQFASDSRNVKLEGEAYFKVKTLYDKNGKRVPFKVVSNMQDIEVLGTQFNVNAYRDQRSTKTTLVEGKVAILDNHGNLILKPNQQAVTASGKTSVKDVYAANFTSWRDGKFSFDGKTFEETLSEIGRWYDLQIVYEKEIPKEELTGDAFRNQNIGFVLRLMDVAEIDYKLDVSKRILTIKGKKKM